MMTIPRLPAATRPLISAIIAASAALAMIVPAASAEVTTSVTVGNGGVTQPIVLAMAVVPDNNGSTTNLGDVEVDPEAALPFNQDFVPATLDPLSDGWKRVKFYVVAYHPTEFEFNINKVSVNVFYDAGQANRKFELDGIRTGTSHTWVGSNSYNTPQFYPSVSLGDTPEQGVVPNWTAKELLYTATQKDKVDTNADDDYSGEPDVVQFLTSYGNRVKLSSDPFANLASIQNLLLEEQAIVLELTGFIWFHQPAQTYYWDSKVSSNGSDSDVLSDSFKFNKLVSFYLDTNNVVYGNTRPNSDVSTQAPADRFLSTVGQTTIWDNGNTDAQVSVQSTKMVLNWNGQAPYPPDYDNPLKTITSFDAALYYQDPVGPIVQVGHVDYTADQSPILISKGSPYNPIETGPDGPVLLQACRPAKIEFSISTGNIWQGVYGGRLTISAGEYNGSQEHVPPV